MTEEEEGPRTVRLDPSQLPGGSRFAPPVIPEQSTGTDSPEPAPEPARAESDRAGTDQGNVEVAPNALTRIAPLPPDLLARLAEATPASEPPAAETPTAETPAAEPSADGDAAPVGRSSDQTVVQKSPIKPAPSVRTDQTAVHRTPAGIDQTAIRPATPANPVAGKASVPPPAHPDPAYPASAPPAPAAPDPFDLMANPDMPTIARPAWTVEPGWSAYPNGVPPQPADQPPSFDSAAPPAPSPAQGQPSVEHTSSLAGALLGSASAPTPTTPEPSSNTGRTILIVALVLLVAVAVGAGVAVLAGDTIMSVLNGVLS